MNANELANDRADILADELLAYHNKGVCGRAAKMLRQQQSEIEELKAKLGCDPAYFDMPARKLTNEEIEEIFTDVYGYDASHLNMEFARAILRKAQEK